MTPTLNVHIFNDGARLRCHGLDGSSVVYDSGARAIISAADLAFYDHAGETGAREFAAQCGADVGDILRETVTPARFNELARR